MAHAAQAARRAGAARVGRMDFFLVCGPFFASAARGFFFLVWYLGYLIFSSLDVDGFSARELAVEFQHGRIARMLDA
jgi:hypothetical protein